MQQSNAGIGWGRRLAGSVLLLWGLACAVAMVLGPIAVEMIFYDWRIVWTLFLLHGLLVAAAGFRTMHGSGAGSRWLLTLAGLCLAGIVSAVWNAPLDQPIRGIRDSWPFFAAGSLFVVIGYWLEPNA